MKKNINIQLKFHNPGNGVRILGIAYVNGQQHNGTWPGFHAATFDLRGVNWIRHHTGVCYFVKSSDHDFRILIRTRCNTAIRWPINTQRDVLTRLQNIAGEEERKKNEWENGQWTIGFWASILYFGSTMNFRTTPVSSVLEDKRSDGEEADFMRRL